MAKSRVVDVPVKENGGWKGFVQVYLPMSFGKEVLDKAIEGKGIEELVNDLIHMGYKVSISYQEKQLAYVCAVTGQTGCLWNEGYTLSTWGGTLRRTVGATWYKVMIVCEGGAWDAHGTQSGLEI